MVMCRDLRSKLVRRIDRRIDVPAELFLRHGERMHDVLEWSVPNHEKIDIARRPELAPCCGPEHERDLNALAKRCESLSEDIDQSSRLRKQPAQLRKNGRLAVRLEVHLTPLDIAPHQTRRGEQFQLALDGSNGGSGLTNDLPKVVGLVGVPEQPAEHPTAGTTEQDGCGVDTGAGRRCSQDGNERNHIENIGQAWMCFGTRSAPRPLGPAKRLQRGLERVKVRLRKAEVHPARPTVGNRVEVELPVRWQPNVTGGVLAAEARNSVIRMVPCDRLGHAGRQTMSGSA
jgi:hypothetical protein